MLEWHMLCRQKTLSRLLREADFHALQMYRLGKSITS
jgi:hypothetical protein